MLKKILLVEDDSLLRTELAEQLEEQGDYSIQQAASAHEAYRLLEANFFDLVILDIGLPDENGREICRKLRERKNQVPIVMLTSHSTDIDVIQGFDAGANDYVLKPFRIGVLIARIESQIKNHERQQEAEFMLGDFRFLPGVRLLIDSETGKRIPLTEKECRILKYLYRAGDNFISRRELLSEIWGYSDRVSTHTLETHIYRLRKKIEPKGNNLLVTGDGGYRLRRVGGDLKVGEAIETPKAEAPLSS